MKEILVNCTEDETRIAILTNAKLSDLVVERKQESRIVGNIYRGRVEQVIPGLQAAFVNIGLEKNAYLPFSDLAFDRNQLQRGKEILVQIAKEPISTKGAKITAQVSLPGRFLVYTPQETHIGVSRSIQEENERERLKAIMEGIKPDSGGFIVRSEASGQEAAVLKREVKYLTHLWEAVHKKSETAKPPALLHQDLGPLLRTARDYLTEDVKIFLIDASPEYQETLNFVEAVLPHLKDRVVLYDGKTPILEAYKVEPELDKIRRPKVGLPSGGYIIIQEAETLCAIDVNTGKFIGKSASMEETILITNLEAVEEVASQVRLRNIGGIIVIDFIDMKRRENNKKIVRALLDAMEEDKAKIKILPVTRLGLVEMTRERRAESLISLLSESCPYCQGSGRVLSLESMYIKIKKEIVKLASRPGFEMVRLIISPPMADYFTDDRRAVIEKRIGRKIRLELDSAVHREDYKIILG